MRKNFILLLFGLGISSLAWSQQLSPSVIASNGGINRAAGISLEWTLGEPTIESLSTADRLYTQGFHQPVLLVRKLQPGPAAVVNSNAVAEVNPIAGYKVTIAPNPVKSILLVNIASLNNVHIQLQNQLNHQISFITLSEKGVFYKDDSDSKIIPTHIRNIADVSGAGDTVIAVASLVYATTKNMNLAAEMANIAGGLVCEEVGTAAIDKDKFMKECEALLG